MNIVGYSDVWSVAPGERIRFMVSTTHPRYEASIVRVFHGDPKPGGPGRKVHPVETAVCGDYSGREQSYPLGSYGLVEPPPPVEVADGFAVSAWVFPTTPGAGEQGVVTCWREGDRRGWGLFLEQEGDLGLRIDGHVFRTGVPLRAFAWTHVRAEIKGLHVRLEQRPLVRFPLDASAVEVSVEHELAVPPAPTGLPLVLAGHSADDGPVGRFNGKLEAPCVESGGGVVASWDLAREIDGERICDASGNGHHGRLVNMPMRAVTGTRWAGSDVDWTQAPEQYAAVFFHDDDLEDAGGSRTSSLSFRMTSRAASTRPGSGRPTTKNGSRSSSGRRGGRRRPRSRCSCRRSPTWRTRTSIPRSRTRSQLRTSTSRTPCSPRTSSPWTCRCSVSTIGTGTASAAATRRASARS